MSLPVISGGKDSRAEDEVAATAAAATAASWLTTGSDEQYIFSYGRALEPKFSNPSIAGYYRPWRFIDKKRSGISRVFYARSREFRIALDVSQFSHENVTVKLVGDLIVVEATHPTVDNYLGRISRELVRKYKTPPDLKLETITGKYKRGFLILWGDRNFEPAEQPKVGMLDEKDGDDEQSVVNRTVSGGQQLQQVAGAKVDLRGAPGVDGAGRAGGGRINVASPAETIIRVRKSSSPSSSEGSM